MSYKALESFADNGTASFVAVVTSLVIDSLEEFVTYTITIQPVSNGVEVRGLSGNTVQVTTWSDGKDMCLISCEMNHMLPILIAVSWWCLLYIYQTPLFLDCVIQNMASV